MANGLEYLVSALLLAESIFALGIFFEALTNCVRRTPIVLERISAYCDVNRQSDGPACPIRPSLVPESRLHKQMIRADRLIRELLTSSQTSGGESDLMINGIAAQLRADVDRGARQFAGFLTKTAPLLGLAGTLLGISLALVAFNNNPESPQAIIAGFATAINTTLWGVLIACVALVSTRLLWQPTMAAADSKICELIVQNRKRYGKQTKKQQAEPKPEAAPQRRITKVKGQRRKGGRHARTA